MFRFAELNYVLDRNTYIAKMMATDIADQLPSVKGIEFVELIPHTRASFQIPVSEWVNFDRVSAA